ncbi:hypothetical protein RBSH_00630 [Rhodopirellula baltica SH28]|uniref:Uncharacterized protein n=1 Tax=Rhodopirellula baltica SH28 TaxID=993517 RepID=K5DLX2_RHOBT|nr:hypothetical protein RBSH_00630 [Rhodopirellula baltica SH28]
MAFETMQCELQSKPQRCSPHHSLRLVPDKVPSTRDNRCSLSPMVQAYDNCNPQTVAESNFECEQSTHCNSGAALRKRMAPGLTSIVAFPRVGGL